MGITQLKHISLYAVSLVLVKGVSLITLPLMTHFLTPEQVGQLELLGITTVFLSLLVGLSMHENLYRFIGTLDGEEQRREKAAELYSLSLTLSLLLSASLYFAYQLFAPSSLPVEPKQGLLMALVLCFEAPLAIGLAWLRLHNQAQLFFKLCMATVTAQVALLLLVLFIRPDVTTLFAVNVLCTFGQFLFLHHYLGFHYRLPTFKQCQHYLYYSAPLMLSGVVAFGLSGAERWIIAGITDLATLGLYAIAAKFALAVGIALQPFHMWWMPKRFEAMEKSGRDYVANTTTQGAVLLCILALVIGWLSQLFIAWVMPHAYQAAIPFIGVTIIMMIFKEMVELVNFGLLYQRKTNQLLLINLFSTTLAFGVCFAAQNYGTYAVLLALMTGQISRFVLVLYQSQALAPLNYPVVRLTGLLLLTCLFIVTSQYSLKPQWSMLMLGLELCALLAYAARVELIHVERVRSLIVELHGSLGKAS
ncbi:lipopolysaccharide biosynthesis protein [Vibrio sinaloensis]|uniref:lipopolysaccharide biosynthesis protein n=1 Tax=Photobacterium sp. (strain ATCC 43367) TaxID=379097 RepID=UPI00205D3335|nr:oligosaccharide flippase family protein [Vibrio sinaloensis]UPQ89198.1 lipopolysaccharide biosynthesis protein [Vibrio sinaloensis]